MKVGDLVRVSARKDQTDWDEEWDADTYGIFLGMLGDYWTYETIPPSPMRGEAHPDYWEVEIINENW